MGNLTDAKASAVSLLRYYSKENSLRLADRYAAECLASGDASGASNWAAAASWIAELIERGQRLSEPA